MAALYEIATWMKKNNAPYLMRYTAGSSLILYLLGITAGNPLPPQFGDGQNIPWQTLWGYGDSFLQFNIGLPTGLYDEILELLSSHWLNGFCDGVHECFEDDAKEIKISRIACVFLLDADSVEYQEEQSEDLSPNHIEFRDDVFEYLMKRGFTQEYSWTVMERVGSGRGLPAVTEEIQKTCDQWFIDRCQNVRYLPPKAGAVEESLFRVKLQRVDD